MSIESMVKYFGHNPAKQFIRGKPVRFGFKNWTISLQKALGHHHIPGPYIVFVEKLTPDDEKSLIRLHPITFGKFLASHNINDIKGH